MILKIQNDVSRLNLLKKYNPYLNIIKRNLIKNNKIYQINNQMILIMNKYHYLKNKNLMKNKKKQKIIYKACKQEVKVI